MGFSSNSETAGATTTNTSTSRTFSTGPLENAANNRSTSVIAKVLNNGTGQVKAEVSVFRLNGKKKLITRDSVTLAPGSSDFLSVNLNRNVLQFEVEIKITGRSALLGVFGKTAGGNLNPTHRVLNSEFTRVIRRKSSRTR
ncbi:hypothetical protein [Paenibacillus agilis]|uniref:CARDB domain-containing protein n=1 Tax=Paenibacillus agilis TaxID=3020863 RepID=A0A559IYW7_9BACL|nr:hypothetical protein [Paenibacillus agilis]TVX92834.1 hypothetical protein FPZ44_07060 [Paenibacillus agilis]